jgi:hypothetical protein
MKTSTCLHHQRISLYHQIVHFVFCLSFHPSWFGTKEMQPLILHFSGLLILVSIALSPQSSEQRQQVQD